MQFISTGERYLSLEKLSELFELRGQYPRFYDLKKRVIEPAINEINENTTLNVEWEPIKKGRTVIGLFFVFENDDKKKLKIST